MTQGQNTGQNAAPDENLPSAPTGNTEDALEQLSDSLPSPTRKRAEIALDVLQGKDLPSFAVRHIESLGLGESLESQVDKLKHLYGASLTLVTLMVKKGLLENNFTLNGVCGVTIASVGATVEQRAAFKKLQEISASPTSVVGSFWKDLMMDKLREGVNLMSTGVDGAIDAITGTDNSPSDSAPEEEKGFYNTVKGFVTEHPIASLAIVTTGAIGGYFLTKKVIKGVKEKGPIKGSVGVAKSLKNWALGGVAVAGTLFVAGQVLGLDVVQKFFEKKGISIEDNRVLKAMILFAGFDFLEGIMTLRKGTRKDTFEELHRHYQSNFQLSRDASIWVCADENFKEFMSNDYSNGHSIAAGGLASIPLIGWFFEDKTQVGDEMKLQEGLRPFMDKIKERPGWEKLTINDALKELRNEVLNNPDSAATTRYTTVEEREILEEREEQEVNDPAGDFDTALDSVEPEKGITAEQKKEITDSLGENGLLGDLEHIHDQLPDWYRRLSQHFTDTVIGAATFAGAEATGTAFGALGPDILDPNESLDKEASKDQLEAFFEQLGIKEMELVSKLMEDTEAFHDFTDSLKAGEPFTVDQKKEFEEWKDLFYGPDGHFMRIKQARFKGNIQSFNEENSKFENWDTGDQAGATTSLLFYSFIGLPIELTFSEDSSVAERGLGVMISAVSVEALSFRKLKPATFIATAPWKLYRGAGSVRAFNVRLWLYGIDRKIGKIASGTAFGKVFSQSDDSVAMVRRLIDMRAKTPTVFSNMSPKQIEHLSNRATRVLDALGESDEGKALLKAAYKGASNAGPAAPAAAAGAAASNADEVLDAGVMAVKYRVFKDLATKLDDFDNVDEVADWIMRSTYDDFDDLSRLVGSIDDVSPGEAWHAIENATDEQARRWATEIIKQRDNVKGATAAAAAGDTTRAGFFSRRFANTAARYTTFKTTYATLKGSTKTLMTSIDAVTPTGSPPVPRDVAFKILQKYPDLADSLDDTARMTEIFDDFGLTGSNRSVEGLVKKARLAQRAQQALLALAIVVDIFVIGLSIYRIKDLEEIIRNTENPHIKEIYKDKKTREYVNIGLSATSLVVSVTTLSLSALAPETAGALAVALGLSGSMSWTGVGLVVTGVLLVAGGVMYGLDKIDESRMEIAYEKDDWKGMPSHVLYKTWAMQVGASDMEVVLHDYGSVKRGIAEGRMISGMEQSEYIQGQTREEIVEALIERSAGIFGDAKKSSPTDQSIVSYSMQYVRSALGDEFDPGTLENGKKVISDSMIYARMMVSGEQMQVRKRFFEQENVADYFPAEYAFQPSQLQLTEEQQLMLPPGVDSTYDALVSLTPMADFLPNNSFYAENFEALPQSSDVELNVSEIETAMSSFYAQSMRHLGERLEQEHPVIFANLKELPSSVVAGKLKEIRMVQAMTGGVLPAQLQEILPALILYVDYLGDMPAIEMTYPSVQALQKWAIDIGSSHQIAEASLKEERGDYLRTDEEVMDQYGVAKNKFLYVLYKLAVGVFGYAGSADEQSLKRLYSRAYANVFGVYWSGKQWVVQEAGIESDNELPMESDVSYEELYAHLIDEFERHSDDIFEHTSRIFFSIGGRNAKSQEIAEYYLEILKEAGVEYDKMAVDSGGYKMAVTSYIMDRSEGGEYVVLPGHLIAKGVASGVSNLGQFAYRYEDSEIVSYKLTEANVEVPHIFSKQRQESIESFEVIGGAEDYRLEMQAMVDEVDVLIHASGNELDIPEIIDEKLHTMRGEVNWFVDSLGSYPQVEQQGRLREFYEEVDEFRRIATLSILARAEDKVFSDDVDGKMVDEEWETNLAMKNNFRYSGMISKHWKKLDEVVNRVSGRIGGEEFAGQYMDYFYQEISLALVKSVVLKFDSDSGEYKVQSWKKLDIDELERNLKEVLAYEEWMQKYKGKDVGETSVQEKRLVRSQIIEELS
jgi:hypothetical protein